MKMMNNPWQHLNGEEAACERLGGSISTVTMPQLNGEEAACERCSLTAVERWFTVELRFKVVLKSLKSLGSCLQVVVQDVIQSDSTSGGVPPRLEPDGVTVIYIKDSRGLLV
jgi:hypothetical protein